MKKTPMIALKSVKTLPATMLATERLLRILGRAELLQPLGGLLAGQPSRMAALAHPPLIAKRAIAVNAGAR